MTLNHLPDYVTTAALEAYGITPEDVRRLCPLATEHGTASAPNWHREDIVPLLDGKEWEEVP